MGRAIGKLVFRIYRQRRPDQPAHPDFLEVWIISHVIPPVNLLEMTVFFTVFPVGLVIDIDVDDDEAELTSAPPSVTRLRLRLGWGSVRTFLTGGPAGAAVVGFGLKI